MVTALRGVVDGPLCMEEEFELEPGDPLYWMEMGEDPDESAITSNSFCPGGPGAGVDPTCSPGFPKAPTFVSAQAKNVEANEKAVKELLELAKKGDIAGIKAHPGTPSPKLQAYKDEMMKSVAEHKAGKMFDGGTYELGKGMNATEIKDLADILGKTIEIETTASGKIMVQAVPPIPAVPPAQPVVPAAPSPSTAYGHQPASSTTTPIAKVPTPPPMTPGMPSYSDLIFMSNLPGSTGPKLMEDKGGTKWAVKDKAGKEDHITNEVEADHLYRVLGVKVPESGLIKVNSPGVGDVAKVSKWIEGSQELGEWRKGKSDDEIQAMNDKIAKNFVADALLANWDVAGMGSNNIKIGKDGEPVRIDNGGALRYRAQGTPKGADFGKEVRELETLRDLAKNPDSAKIFSKLTNADILKQIKEVMGKKKDVLDAVKDPVTKDILKQRFVYLNKAAAGYAGALTIKAAAVPPTALPQSAPAASVPTNPMHTGIGLADFIKANVKVAPHSGTNKVQIEKIKLMNPNGIKDGTIKIPSGMGDKSVQNLINALPVGTIISKVKIAPKDIGLNVVYKNGNPHIISSSMQGSTTATTTSAVGKTGGPSSVEHGQTIHFPSQSKPVPETKMVPWRASLTSGEQAAIHTWKGSAFQTRDEISSGKMSATAKDFMSGVMRSPVNEGTFHRGLSGEYAKGIMAQLEKAGTGCEWSDDAPHGMSRSAKIGADKFSMGQLLFSIKTKNAHSMEGVHDYDDESEHVGELNTRYRVNRIVKDAIIKDHNGKSHKVEMWAELEEIPK